MQENRGRMPGGIVSLGLYFVYDFCRAALIDINPNAVVPLSLQPAAQELL
jgi:hypothetical protein